MKPNSFKSALKWAIHVIKAHLKDLSNEEAWDAAANIRALEDRLRTLTKKRKK